MEMSLRWNEMAPDEMMWNDMKIWGDKEMRWYVMRWDGMRWDGRWNGMVWDEREMVCNEFRWDRWDGTKRDDVKWDEDNMRWDAMKWGETKWYEMTRDEMWLDAPQQISQHIKYSYVVLGLQVYQIQLNIQTCNSENRIRPQKHRTQTISNLQIKIPKQILNPHANPKSRSRAVARR